MAEEQDGEITFSSTNSSKEQLNGEKVYKITSDRQQRTSGAKKSSPLSSKGEKKICFSFFFFFFLFFFVFLLFFLIFFSFLSFLLLVFLSYFLLKSSNTPLLFLNFHFHLNTTLQKKKGGEKKKKERSPIFKLNSIYISKFGVFVFVFKYFISNSLTSKLNLLIFVYQYVI